MVAPRQGTTPCIDASALPQPLGAGAQHGSAGFAWLAGSLFKDLPSYIFALSNEIFLRACKMLTE